MRFDFSAGAFVYRMRGSSPEFLVLFKSNGESDLPKGHIEKGESSEVAARREIREETGLEPEFLPFFSVKTEYFFREKGETVHKEVRNFIGKVSMSQRVRISYEHKGYGWLGYDDAARALGYKDLLRIFPSVFKYINRYERMSALNREYARLPEKNRGWGLSRRHVRGEGRLDAEIMILGQAPGRNEDKLLRPFVGRSGKLLERILKDVKIKRQGVYITSVVQFFPPENRMPSRKEIEVCEPFLFRQIGIIKPEYVVLLGNLATGSILGMGEVEKNHGKIITRNGVTYMITFHPAAALRSTGTLRLMEKDFEKLRKLLSHKKS